MSIREFAKRHSLIIGIALMFLFTWPIDLANTGLFPFQVPFVVYIFLGWGFILASILMTGITQGKQGVSGLLKGFLRWRVEWKWYLVALCLYPALWVVGVYLNAILTSTPVDFSRVLAYQLFGESANLPLFILPWFLFEIITNGEELGWRGYILPRLQSRYSALNASLITGVIWGFWHLPKFLSHFNPLAFTWFMVHILAFSVVLTWLYNGTKGSLVIVMICHAASNTVGTFLPVASSMTSEHMGAYITVVLLEAAAAVIVSIAMSPVWLRQSKAFQ